MEGKVRNKLLLICMSVLLVIGLIVINTPPASAAPKPEGTVVIREATACEEGFLPWIGGSATMIWEIVYDYLIYTKTDGTHVPGLAKRWKVSEDARTVTAWLRQGIPWQGGWGEVTAEDVKYTFERIMAADSTNWKAPELRGSIKSIEVVDPYTIVWHLNSPDPVWWLYMTDIGASTLPIVCKKYIETVGDEKALKEPVGSGPYRLVEHKFGDYLKFEALEEHWRIVPEFKYLVMRVVAEESTAVAMLKTGSIDVTQISPTQITELKESGLRVAASPCGYAFMLVFGGMLHPEDKRFKEGYHRQDPWTDIRVREAMNIAIDRDAIIKAIYPGAASPLPIAWPLPGWKELKPIPYDPARAKELLVEAGYPDGFTFKLYSYPMSPGAELPKVIEAIAGYWEMIGLEPRIIPTDWSMYKPKRRGGETAGELALGNAPTKPDWTTVIVSYYLYECTQPYFQAEELQNLIEKLTIEVDWDKRNKMWRRVNQYLRDNYTVVSCIYANIVRALSTKVEGVPPTRTGEPANYVYIRHAQPLNTFRLFELE